MGQFERGLNRLYGIEQDRPTLQKYGRAFVLAITAGVLAVLVVRLARVRQGDRRRVQRCTRVATVWAIVRWPLALALMMGATALLFRWSPRRHQPAWSWLAFGATVSVLLWAAVTVGLGLFFRVELVVRRDLRPARRHRRAAALGAALVGRRAVRRRGRRPARGGPRPARPQPQDTEKVAHSEPESDADARARRGRCRVDAEPT